MQFIRCEEKNILVEEPYLQYKYNVETISEL